MDYRFYLMDGNSHVRAGESFIAKDDNEAVEIAATLYDSCCDVFARYELWCGALLISQSASRYAEKLKLDAIIQTRQASVLDLEDRLEATFTIMRRSRKLTEVQAHLRNPRARMT